MSLTIHRTNPTDLVEDTFFRIQQERMADVPVLNQALAVAAVDFQLWHGHWLGVLVTPWCMSLLLLPGKADDWHSVGDNKRRFVKFPSGDFAFLGSVEEGLGEFQSCSLFSPMDRFSNQAEAVMTAKAALMALLQPVAAEAAPDASAAAAPQADAPVSPARRRFFAPFVRAASGNE